MNAGALRLSDYPDEKIILRCRRCDWQARYYRDALIARVGADVSLPTLRLRIAERLGCELAVRNLAGDPTQGVEQCGMHYPALLEGLSLHYPGPE